MDVALLAVIAIVIIALAFDFTNGFHDAANSIATIVSTGVLSPKKAVAWAAFFNVVAFFVIGTHVANTIAKGVVDQAVLGVGVIFAGLVGAIVWNLLTFYLALPSSSSHALVGGICGAAVVHSGFDALQASGLRTIAVFIVLSPLLGMATAFILHVILLRACSRVKNLRLLNRMFRVGQLISSAALSLAHGGNDAQKTMGVILALLITSGHLPTDADVPDWVVLSAYIAIGAGTMAGGWRIVKTLGSRITKLQPSGGVVAETSAAAILYYATSIGVPVSTTHTVTGTVAGVGATRRISAVRWNVASKVIVAWVLTVPGAFAAAAITELIVRGLS